MNCSILPMLSDDGLVIDGVFIKAPNFCIRKHFKCSGHYEKIKSLGEGFYVCPYGFVSYVLKDGQQSFIFTSLRIKDLYSNKANAKLLKEDNSPVLKLSEINHFNRFFLENNAIVQELEESNEFIKDTLHEIRRLNRALKHQSEEAILSANQKDYEFLLYRLNNLFFTSSLVSLRLNSYDVRANPELLNVEEKREVSVYKKFEKVRHCLQVLMGQKNLKMEVVGNSFHLIQAKEIFELLPFLIYDNALKYSPQDQTITTIFSSQGNNRLHVQISSYGPKLKEEEELLVFNKKYRGEIVRDMNISGTGTGLNLAKEICQMHNIDIAVKSDSSATLVIDGIEYFMFNVNLLFN